MVYKQFTWQIILLQILLSLTLLSFLYTLFRPRMLVTSINLGIMAILEIVYIIYTVNKTNRDLMRFLNAFRFQDSTVTFEADPHRASFSPLYKKLESILEEFRLIRSRTENERFFYLNALNHTGTGLLIVDAFGKVRYSNRAMQKMMNLTYLDKLSRLNRLKPGLAEDILQMTPNSKELIKIVLNNEVVYISLRCTVFRISEEIFRIVSFQDIKFEIEQNEAEAWQKLIRILTHEIMNSVSPITLTSSGIIQMLEKDGKIQDISSIDDKTWKNVIHGLHAIRKRSKGLSSFVESYQTINHLPQPVLSRFPVSDLASQIEVLMKEELRKNTVNLDVLITPPSLMLYADEKLVSQILINLVQNAVYALENRPGKLIRLRAFQINDQVRISVTDNGKGIPPDLLDSVFVPFYSTRDKGSGIGLSLAREIMKLHDGGIQVHSNPGIETTFTLIF